MKRVHLGEQEIIKNRLSHCGLRAARQAYTALHKDFPQASTQKRCWLSGRKILPTPKKKNLQHKSSLNGSKEREFTLALRTHFGSLRQVPSQSPCFSLPPASTLLCLLTEVIQGLKEKGQGEWRRERGSNMEMQWADQATPQPCQDDQLSWIVQD